MTKHTPFSGTPWETSTFTNSDGDIIWDVCEVEAGDMVAEISGHGDEAEKRANLIAAAPEGLEANKLTLRNVEAMLYALPVKADASERQSLETWASIVRAAIAKAEGGAP